MTNVQGAGKVKIMLIFQSFDENKYGVTIKSQRTIAELQKSNEYGEDDSYAIYEMLINNMKPVDFGYYLKRYVYKAAGFTEDFESVPVKEFADVIIDAFSNKGIPCSWKRTSTRLPAAVKNWLTQKTVSREAVIMLGFGLDMSLEDINDFLTKGLKESILSPKNPAEAICWYCVKYRKGFFRFRDLLAEYEKLPGTTDSKRNISTTGTLVLRTEVEEIRDDKTLLRYLNQLRRIDGKTRQSVEARRQFDQLYDEASRYIAELKNEEENDQKGIELGRLKDKLARDDRYYDTEKQEQIRNFSNQKKHWTKEDITPAYFENELFSAIPKDRNGNLLPIKGSALNEQFSGKRLNRQHLQEILDGTGIINRYDLATMSFFVMSQRKELEENSFERYQAFVEQTNQILDRCGMGDLYDANPYDAFLKICMLSDYPLGTYADVWGMAYDLEQQTES